MNEIIPSVIPQNLNIIRERFGQILGAVRKVQMDIVDGSYAPTKTWPFNDNQFEEMREITSGVERFPHIDDFILEIDMLVLHPIECLGDFISMGAKSFIIHIDSTDHVQECIDTVKNSRNEAGLGIRPSVDTDFLQPFLPSADFVQFMGNDRVGYSGVDLDENVFKKIKSFHQRHPSIPIQIDIGVNEETIPKLKAVGVTRFISGSSIFNASNIKEAIIRLQNS